MTKKWAPILLSVLFLTSCFEGGGDDFNLVSIADVAVDCSEASVSDCSNAFSGSTVYVGWRKGSGVDCEDLWESLPDNNFTAYFEAVGSGATNYQNTALQVTLNSWQDGSGPVTILEDVDFTICAFVDINSNGDYELGEPIGVETNASPAVAEVEITDWFI